MKKNKTKIILFFIILSAAIFSGCANIEINGQIDPDFLVTYGGIAEFNLSQYSTAQKSLTQESLLTLSEYWKDAGYSSEVTLDGESYAIYFSKQKQCNDYEEALDTLFIMMTDEYSPLSSLSYLLVPYENLSEYNIKGSIDIHGFFDSEVLLNLNEGLQNQIAEELQKSDISLNFILPNHANLSDINRPSETFKIEINTDSITNFEISGQLYNSKIAAINAEIVEKYRYYTQLKYVLGAVLFIIIILTIVVLSKGRSRMAG